MVLILMRCPKMLSSFIDLDLPVDGSDGDAMQQACPVYVAAIGLSSSEEFLELTKSALLAGLEALEPGSLFGLATLSHKLGIYDVQGQVEADILDTERAKKGKQIVPRLPKLMAKRALLKVFITMQQEARSDELFAVDVGPALQFLEFCTAFGEILQLKKGEPESILKEATSGCTLRRRQYSPPVRFHTQLLAMIQKDMMRSNCPSSPISNGSSWFQELGKHISSSRYSSKEFTPELFTRGNSGYEDLDSSKKLQLLNFLCDEALCTKDSRAWIEEQNEKLVQKGKEAKEKVLAAKEKEKQLKQQMQDEVAKEILEKNGGPLSISEHEDLVSKIKTDAAKDHAERLEALGMVPKNSEHPLPW